VDRPAERKVPLLVLGLGNVLCGDDGLGPAVIHRLLRRYEPPPGTLVLDGGTLGLSLLPLLEDAEAVLMVDAVRADAPPGSFLRLEGADVAPAVRDRLSVHQVGVADLLDGLRLRDREPAKMILLGCVPATLDLCLGRSPEVEAAIPAMVEWVVEEARALGQEFQPETSDAPFAPLDLAAGRGTRALGL
jgi:hydrogenase maturation protease